MGDLRRGESEVKLLLEVKGTGAYWRLVTVNWPVD